MKRHALGDPVDIEAEGQPRASCGETSAGMCRAGGILYAGFDVERFDALIGIAGPIDDGAVAYGETFHGDRRRPARRRAVWRRWVCWRPSGAAPG